MRDECAKRWVGCFIFTLESSKVRVSEQSTAVLVLSLMGIAIINKNKNSEARKFVLLLGENGDDKIECFYGKNGPFSKN